MSQSVNNAADAGTLGVSGFAQSTEERLAGAFETEQREGLRLSVRGGTAALSSIAILLLFLTPFPAVLYYHALLLLFAAIGLAIYWVSKKARYRPAHGYLFAAIDFALLAFTLIYPNPLIDDGFPPQMTLRFENFIYFFVLVCGLAFTYQPKLMLGGALIGATTWSLGVLWIVMLPETKIEVREGADIDELLQTLLQPTFVDLGVRLQEVVILILTGALLSIAVTRSRRLVLRQARLERERGNLARHFAPSMVDRLAQMDSPLRQVREQQVAVLFADIVGFTTWAEGQTPAAVIALLRSAHGRLERAIFEHGGTLDKFIGDGVMATFGTPETSAEDAANALRCVHAILNDFEAWNRLRAGDGEAPIRISLGLHFGPVIMGDIGSERCLEFAVLGDTVNLASRLERMTRKLNCRAMISDAAVRAVDAIQAPGNVLAGLQPAADQEVRGRSQKVAVWTL